jgi:hypothetical protein
MIGYFQSGMKSIGLEPENQGKNPYPESVTIGYNFLRFRDALNQKNG